MSQRTRAPGAEKPPYPVQRRHHHSPMPRRSAWALAAALLGLTFLVDVVVRSLS